VSSSIKVDIAAQQFQPIVAHGHKIKEAPRRIRPQMSPVSPRHFLNEIPARNEPEDRKLRTFHFRQKAVGRSGR